MRDQRIPQQLGAYLSFMDDVVAESTVDWSQSQYAGTYDGHPTMSQVHDALGLSEDER